MATIRERLDAYVSEKYGIEPEWLPLFHEDYAVYRHTETGKWFAVFITKDRERVNDSVYALLLFNRT